MIRSLIKLIVIIVIAIFGYNYFWGTPTEKEQAKSGMQKIGNGLKEAGGAVKDLIVSEKEKFNKGKYDKVLSNMKDIFKDIKEEAKSGTAEIKKRLKQLEEKREKLENAVGKIDEKDVEKAKEKGKEVGKELDKLYKETQELLKELKEN